MKKYVETGINKILLLVPVAALMGIILTACGASSPEVTLLEINKDGEIKNVIYEEFGEDYDLGELTDMASREISSYNSDFISPKLSMEEPEIIDNGAFVKLTMDYKSASDYSHFNNISLFYGTVQEAVGKGYAVPDDLIGRDGEKMEKDFLEGNQERHIIITTDRSNIKTPYDIEYASEGVMIINKREAMLEDAKGDTALLLLSK